MEIVLDVIIFGLIGAVLGAGVGCLIYICFFYKGREIRIFVVRKRINLYKVYSREHGSYNVEHYVVYAKYPDSDKIHTLGCDGYIYRKLSANRGHTVTVRLMHITKVHREKLRSKKKR